MLEQRKLRIVCFKATLTKSKGVVKLDIHRQLVREIRGAPDTSPENEYVRMVAVPELRGRHMYLFGRYNKIPERDANLIWQFTDQYWSYQKDNLFSAGRWIKQLMEEGHYGYGKQYR